MMKLSLIAVLMLVPAVASAQEHKTLGFQVDVGVPDGVGVGVVVSPVVNWLHLGLSGTYNGLGPGLRAGVTLDPIKYWVSPSLTVEGGLAFPGQVPGLNNSPNVGYDYLNVHAGLEFGRRDRIRFFIHAGPTFMNVNGNNFGQYLTQDQSITIANPSATVTLLPTVKFGLTAFVW